MTSAKFFSIAFMCLAVLFTINGLQAQNQLPLNHMAEMKAAMKIQNEKQDSALFAARGFVLGNCCEDVWLLVPEDPNNPGYKINLPLGVNLKPILESYITGGATTLSLSAVGDAVGCNVQCGDQMITDWSLGTGNIFGTNINYGTFSIIQADQPGNYIILGRTSDKGCFVAETFKVTCDADTVFLTDPNSTATLQLDICDELAAQLQATSLSDLSNVTFDLQLAPNPTATTVKVLLDADGLNVFEKLQIVSMTGQVLLESTSTEINVSELPSSTYIAHIVFQKNLTVNQPFVKL